MITTRLSAKGQVVLPAAVRAARAWGPGMRFEVLDMAEGVLLKPIEAASPFAPTTLEQVFGIAHHAGQPLTVVDMHAAVIAEAARRR